MSSDLLAVLEYMEKEKGISRDDMIATITAALQSAAQKGINAGQDLRVEINPRTGALRAWVKLRVVDSVSDPVREIHVEKAKTFATAPTLGEIVEKEVDPSLLGRIAAQTARQAIMQRIRQFERDRIYDDYKDMVGDIVSGIVRRKDRGDLFVDLGKAEATLPFRERVLGEDYAPGERIRCLLLSIETTPRGPELILSRSNADFIRRLFELEVAEIGDGTVAIEAIAREPGYRSKVCVSSKDSKVDPVGACVGARGARVKGIVKELGGEKVDIIRYYEDPKKLLEEAMRPAIPKNVRIDENTRTIYFEVADADLSIAIGKRGQNAKLTSKILGWRLDIGKEESQDVTFEQRKTRAVEGLNVLGLEGATAGALVAMGITTPDAFDGVTVEDLVGGGFDESQARNILEQVQHYKSTERKG